jgi:hypothetical protein
MTNPVLPIKRAFTRSPSPSSKRPKLEVPSISSAALTEDVEPSSSTVTSVEELVEREMNMDVEHKRTYEKEIDYENKLVLAPMVRTGSCEYHILQIEMY